MANRYGVDTQYFKRELSALSRSLPNRTPDELHRYLLRLAEVAKPQDNMGGLQNVTQQGHAEK